jgi:hypothetical protein
LLYNEGVRSKSKKSRFDVTLLKDALKQSISQRFREACSLYDFYEKVSPFPFQPVVKTFSSFGDYEKWKKRQKDPRLW